MLEIQLPALPGGAAKVLRWLVGEGAAVERGAPLVIVLTDRAEALLPAPAAGVLAGPAAENATVEPGGLLAHLAPAEGQAAQSGAEGPATPHAEPEGVAAAAAPSGATPLARSIARAHGVDLAAVQGTWHRGRVCAADVRAVLGLAEASSQPAQPAQPSPAPLVPPSPAPLAPPSTNGILPTASATVELDVGAALARLAAVERQLAALRLRPGLAACVVEAAAARLPEHPALNARWGDEAIVLRRRVHIAAAEPAEAGGLRWALVCDAGDLTLRGLARALGAAPPADLGAATFAVVCLAPGAGWHSAAPPLPGTAAALSVGAPVRRPVATDSGVAVRPVALLTLSYDARVADHRQAAAFLNAVKATLERPA